MTQSPHPIAEFENLPRFLYGTAWKESDTRRLTALALQHGFCGIDTANQRRHYDEAGVGQAVAAAIESGTIVRKDLFLQTKYTFPRGQDHRLPYDPAASTTLQVQQSFASSLEHLGTTYIDSYVLHGPTQRVGLVADDWEAWRAMEELYDSGRTRSLGVSNVSLDQLESLHGNARIKPRFVQNRCYAAQGWDRRVRAYCRDNNMIYQGFSLLTANSEVLASLELARIAKRHNRTTIQIIFRFAVDIGMLPLTGTSNANHMQTDVDIFDFHLDPDEVTLLEELAIK